MPGMRRLPQPHTQPTTTSRVRVPHTISVPSHPGQHHVTLYHQPQPRSQATQANTMGEHVPPRPNLHRIGIPSPTRVETQRSPDGTFQQNYSQPQRPPGSPAIPITPNTKLSQTMILTNHKPIRDQAVRPGTPPPTHNTSHGGRTVQL